MEIVCREVWPVAGPSPRLLPNGGNRRDRDSFHVSFDPPTEDVVEVVVNAVATIRNAEPSDLDPLQEAVDTDALDRVVAPSGADRSGDFEVTFTYHGLVITVAQDGDLWLKWR